MEEGDENASVVDRQMTSEAANDAAAAASEEVVGIVATIVLASSVARERMLD